jgi:hypothetical protein
VPAKGETDTGGRGCYISSEKGESGGRISRLSPLPAQREEDK